MTPAQLELVRCVAPILERFCGQNGLQPLGEPATTQIGARLWILISVRGLPPRLGPDEMGAPREMSDVEVGPLVEFVLGGTSRSAELAAPCRQLVKACFHAEFRTCRESYRERDASGVCRRQTLAKALVRVSGAHCVDCPYWTSLTLEQHEACLTKAWAGDVAEFAAKGDVFLPADFRMLRQWVQAQAARGGDFS